MSGHAALQARSLYRSLLRAAGKLPSAHKKTYAQDKIRSSFRDAMGETDEEQVRAMLLIGHTQLETLELHIEHLEQVKNQPHYLEGMRPAVTSESELPPL
mmetsp:Transcript_44350/g.108392  ORF Transcript_44350/g.108392 Transcript_44350/m.108392 type:complete len:100 (-) Transcript_44350:234-533(-)